MQKPSYRRLREEGRQVIYRMSKAGKTQQEIAQALEPVWICDNSSYEHPYHLLARYKDNKQVYKSKNPIPEWARPFV